MTALPQARIQAKTQARTQVGGVVGGGAAPLLLDSITTVAAYSVRKLRTAYAGNCLRVRRSSDNVEQDIGFVANELDTATLATFVGANSGFVVTWYDQVGSANYTQSTTTLQPRIVNTGVLDTLGAKACLLAAADREMNNSLAITGPELSVLAVATMAASTSSFGRLFSTSASGTNDFDGTNRAAVILRSGTSQAVSAYINGGERSVSNVTYDTAFVCCSCLTGTQHQMFINGVGATASAITTNFSITASRLFSELITSNGKWSGKCSELIITDTAISSTDRDAIEASAGAFYGVTVA